MTAVYEGVVLQSKSSDAESHSARSLSNYGRQGEFLEDSDWDEGTDDDDILWGEPFVGFNDLSEELIELIVDFVGDDLSTGERAAALAPLAFVARKWRKPVQRAMVRRVFVGSLRRMQLLMHQLIVKPQLRFHVLDAEIFTSAADMSLFHRSLASSPLISIIQSCTNLLYLKIGGIDETYSSLLLAALESCSSLRHFAFRNMTNLFRFQWPVLAALCCRLKNLHILQVTGTFKEATLDWPAANMKFPQTLRGMHLTHTRTTDAELDHVLSMSPLGFTFLALSRPTPGLSYPGLLKIFDRHGATLSQVHLSEPTLLPSMALHVQHHGQRRANDVQPVFILDAAIASCPHLLHLQVRGPHISAAGLQSLPPHLVSLDVAASRYVTPEWLIAGMLKTGKDFKFLRLGCKEMGWGDQSVDAVKVVCQHQRIDFTCSKLY